VKPALHIRYLSIYTQSFIKQLNILSNYASSSIKKSREREFLLTPFRSNYKEASWFHCWRR